VSSVKNPNLLIIKTRLRYYLLWERIGFWCPSRTSKAKTLFFSIIPISLYYQTISTFSILCRVSYCWQELATFGGKSEAMGTIPGTID